MPVTLQARVIFSTGFRLFKIQGTLINMSLTLAGYLLLTTSIVTALYKVDIRNNASALIPPTLALLAAIVFFFSGNIEGTALSYLLPLFGLTLWLTSSPPTKSSQIFSTVVIVFSLFIALHLLPAIHNYPAVSDLTISEGGKPYTLNLNIDKGIAAVLILCILMLRPAPTPVKLNIAIPIVTTMLIVLVGYLSGLKLDIKCPPITWLFLYANLFLTCVAEEAFFRGVIQEKMTALFKATKQPQVYAIIFTSVIFGLAHFSGGIPFIIAGLLAGIIYGYAYCVSGKITVAVLTHFTLNCIHFFFFTYPVSL